MSLFLKVSGQLPPEENCPPPVRVGVLVKARISFRIGGGANRQLPPEENCPMFGVRVWVRVSSGVGGQFSMGAIVLEPFLNNF